MPSKRKSIISLIIFDITLSIAITCLTSNIIIGFTSFIITSKLLHKIYKKSYSTTSTTSLHSEPIKNSQSNNNYPKVTNTKNIKLERILKRKL